MTETQIETGSAEKVTPRLKTRYREEILPALQSEFDIANIMQVPGLTKIVVNMGVCEAARDSKLIEGAIRDLTAITLTVSPFLMFMFLPISHNTSGASEMIFMKRFSRSSRPTGPKMRVPRGSPSFLRMTAAFSSKRM